MSFSRGSYRRIMPYSNLRKLPRSKDNSITGYSVMFSLQQCFLVTSSSWALNPGLCPTISNNLRRWNQRNDTLWWSAIATTKLAPRRIVRSWAARRLRSAFIESLKKFGFSADGSPLDNKNGAPLYGTVQLFANNPKLNEIKNVELDKYMEDTVRLIINQQHGSLNKSTASKFGDERREGKVDAGVAVLLTQDKRLIEFPSILLPPNISSGSIVDITVSRNFISEQKSQAAFLALQDSIHASFGVSEPAPPVLRCRNATQTSVVLEWDPIELATADIISLSLFRNGQKAGNIPQPEIMQSTKISGLGVDTQYTFHLVLRTTAGTYSSERVIVKTHKMTDLSGITVTPGILPAQLRDSLTRAVERIGAKIADSVRIDTTHFVTTEGHGSSWEKAVEMNIPVVRPEWIEGCEAGGRIVGVRQYYLDADPKQRQLAQSEVSTQSHETVKDSPFPLSPESEPGSGQAQPPTPPMKDFKTKNKSNNNPERIDGSRSNQNNSSPSPDPQAQEVDQIQHKSQVSTRPALSPSSITNSEDNDNKSEVNSDVAESETGAPENSSFQDVAL